MDQSRRRKLRSAIFFPRRSIFRSRRQSPSFYSSITSRLCLAADGADREISLTKIVLPGRGAKNGAAYETRTLQRFRHVIAVSDRDCKQMLAMVPGCTITVVPTGFDTEQYQPAPSVAADPPLIVFTGSMDWEPNIDAVEHFCGAT